MDYKQLYKKHKKAVQYTICAVFIMIAGVIYLAGRKNMSASEDTFADKGVLKGTEEVSGTDYETLVSDIYVYICGHVNSPGVVKCQSGMRLYEAVELAGGADDSADMSLVNLAEPVMEEETKGLININKATAEELMTLPGIGSSRAADIVSYRTDNGRFQTIEDIMKVSGIKEAAFNKIRNYICV